MNGDSDYNSSGKECCAGASGGTRPSEEPQPDLNSSRPGDTGQGVGDGQGGLACCDSWGLRELDATDLI